MSTGETSANARSLPIAPLALAAIALVVVGVGFGWLLFGSGGDGTDTTTDTANTTDTTLDDSTGTDGETESTQANGDNTDSTSDGGDRADESNSEDGAADANDDDGNQTVPTTAGSQPDGGANTTTGETVEADREATPDGDVSDDDPTELETTTTTTTALAADGQLCPITPSDVNGQSGVIKPGGDGICNGIELTLRSVVDSADLGTIDWGNDLKLCEKHPSATQISFTVVSASGSTEVTDTFFRGDVADGQDLVAALNVGFNGGYTPIGGVQPIAVCRTTDAEMVIVHRANG